MKRLKINRQLSPDACDTLVSGFLADCDTKPVANLEVDFWLINRGEINTSGCTITGRTISLLALTGGAFAYKFSGKLTSNRSSITMHQNTYDNDWIHLIGAIIFDNSAATKEDIIEKLAAANLVAIMRNKYKGTTSNQEFEVFGWDVGLTMTLGEKKSDDTGTKNTWKVELSSGKDEFEGNAGYILNYASQAATLAAITALEDSGS